MCRVCVRRLLTALSLAAVPAAPHAWAAEAGDHTGPTGASPSYQSLPDLLRQITDIGGLRSRLEQAGVRFTFTYYGDGFANPSGGVRQGPGYDGRFGVIIDGDLEKLVSTT